jgi:hypothetical protein
MPMHQDEKTEFVGSSLHERSRAAFYRDLPNLLQRYCGLWVAYHGDEFIGSAPTQTELFEQCFARGLENHEFVVAFADQAALADHEEIELPWQP